MPDVGVLNLQIHDNSEQAVQGLNGLVDALSRIKTAVSGLGLGSAANQIRKIATAVNESVNDSVITRLNQFGDAMAKLNGIGNININIRGADRISRTIESVEAIRDQMGDVGQIASDAAGSIAEGFETAAPQVQSVTQAFNDLRQSADETRGRLFDMNEIFDPSRLGIGNLGRDINEATTEMRGFGDMARDSAEIVNNMFRESTLGAISTMSEQIESLGRYNDYLGREATSPLERQAEDAERLCGELEQAESQIGELQNIMRLNNNVPVFNSIEEAAQHAGLTVDEFRGRLEETRAFLLMNQRTPVFSTIEEAARYAGISIEEMQRRLEETRTFLLLNQPTPVFDSIEAAAEHAGVSVERMREMVNESLSSVNMPNISEGSGENGENPFLITLGNMQEEATETIRLIELLRDKIQILEEEVDSGVTERGTLIDEKGIVNRQIQIEQLTEQLAKLEERQASLNGLFASNNVAQNVDQMVNSYSQIDLMTMKMNAMQQALVNDIAANRLSAQGIADRAMKIQDLASRIEELRQRQQETTTTTERLNGVFGAIAGALKSLKSGIQGMFPGITGLIKRFGSLIKYRMLRSIIRHITQGFTEGVKNVYEYSKAVGTAFAPAMDSAASALAQFKNSIGAAAAPLISALIPLLNQVVSAVIEAVNWLNQLFALLNGQKTWTRALPQTTEAFNKQAKAAGGASKAMKDLLADWDELNIIQSESGGGGGGGSGTTAAEYAEMFEEVSKFDSSVKDAIGWLEDHLPVVNGLVAALGAKLLGLPLSISIGIGLVVTGLGYSSSAGYDMGLNGLSSENLIKGVKGILATTFGAALIGFKLGGGAGGLIGATLGFTISLVVMGVNVRNGAVGRMYGQLEATRDNIKSVIQKYYAFEAHPQINISNTKITGIEDLEKKIEEQIQDVNIASMLVLNSNFSESDVADLAAKVKSLVDDVNALIRANKEYLVFIDLAINPDMKMEDVKGIEGWEILEGITTDLGTEIGKILADGVVDEFEKEALPGLLNALSEISIAITNAKQGEKYKSSMFGIRDAFISGELTKDSFKMYLEETSTLRQQTYEDARRAIDEEAEALASEIAGLEKAKELGYTEWNGMSIDAALEDARIRYSAIDEVGERSKRAQDLYNIWTAGTDEMIQSDVAQAFQSILSKPDAGTTEKFIRESTRIIQLTKKDIKKNLDDELLKYIAYTTDQDYDTLLSLKENSGVTGWSLLPENLKKAFVASLKRNPSISSVDVVDLLIDTYGIRPGELFSAMQFGNLSWKDKNNVLSEAIKKYGNNPDYAPEIGYAKGLMSVMNVGQDFAHDFEKAIKNTTFEIEWNALSAKEIFESFFPDAENGKIEVPVVVELDPYMNDDLLTEGDIRLSGHKRIRPKGEISDYSGDFSDLIDTFRFYNEKEQDILNRRPYGTDSEYGTNGFYYENMNNTNNAEDDEALASRVVAKFEPLINNQATLQTQTNQLLLQLLAKEFIAKVTPSSQLGFNNTASQMLASLVTGE